MNFQRVGGRRFFLAMGSGIVSTLLAWFGKIDGTAYAAVVIGTVAAYITGGTIDNRSASEEDPK
jgi:hypothetical protein